MQKLLTFANYYLCNFNYLRHLQGVYKHVDDDDDVNSAEEMLNGTRPPPFTTV